MNRILIIIGVLVLCLFASIGMADTCTFTATDSNWNALANWDCGHVPTSSDDVIIEDGDTCTVDVTNAVAQSIDVRNVSTEGHLKIDTGKKLTVESATVESDIDGKLTLVGSGSEISFGSEDHTINGTGEIVGKHESAVIRTGGDTVIVCKPLLHGKLKVLTTGGAFTSQSFVVQGDVKADTDGVLEFGEKLGITDAAGNTFYISHGSATLRFNGGASLVGDFVITTGTMKANTSVVTTGDLTMTGGVIDAPGGATFSNY